MLSDVIRLMKSIDQIFFQDLICMFTGKSKVIAWQSIFCIILGLFPLSLSLLSTVYSNLFDSNNPRSKSKNGIKIRFCPRNYL